MRVLMSTPYDLAVPGGVNQQALGLRDALEARGITAKLVGPASVPVDFRDGRVESLGPVSAVARNGAISRVALNPGVITRCRRIMRDFKPTVIHVHEPVVPLVGPALLALVPNGVRRVGTFHTYSERSWGYLGTWPWCRWLWSQLEARVAVSESAREFATRYHRADFSIVPNGVTPPSEVPTRNFQSGRLRLLFVGRMNESRKGFACLVAALRCLSEEELGQLEVVVVGRGSEKWRAVTGELPISYEGQLSDADRERAMARVDALVLPSLGGESFGVVGLEAMIRGLPVIASRLPAYADWMRDAALYFAPNHAQGLANIIRWMTNDPALLAKFSQRAVIRAQAYAWPKLAEDWISIYRGAGPSSGAKLA
jgi:phosphatidyl-myo-inositol alpha-mannosyltransferase